MLQIKNTLGGGKPEGLYAWKKHEIGSELKLFNKSVSTLPYNFVYGSAVVLNGEIHILGGGSNSSSYKYHYKWDGISWISVSTLPYNFYYGSAVVLNNEIHILGGNGGEVKHYKWNGTSWTSASTLPYSFYSGSAVVLNGEIHILGTSHTSYLKSHYKWNGTSWTSASTLPYSFYNGSAVVLNGEIHILGTKDSSGQTKHYKWNGTSWTSASTLPYSFYSGSAVVLDNEIHILGSSFNSSVHKKHYKWDGSSWTSVSTLPYSFYYGSAVVFNNGIHILGSSTSSYRTAHYLIIGYVPVYTFLDYIVSDKENAYPDGGEKGGYWYEKVSVIDLVKIGCTKFEEGSFTPSSDTYVYNATHSLGVIPKFAIVYGGIISGTYVNWEVFSITTAGSAYGVCVNSGGNGCNYSSYSATFTSSKAELQVNTNGILKSGIEYHYLLLA